MISSSLPVELWPCITELVARYACATVPEAGHLRRMGHVQKDSAPGFACAIQTVLVEHGRPQIWEIIALNANNVLREEG